MGRLSKYDSAFKAKVAMEAMKERESLSELAKRFNVLWPSPKIGQDKSGQKELFL